MRIRDPRAIGALIRDRRRTVGWSQTELAERIGASRSWISEAENGKDSAEIGLVLRALDALGLAVDVRQSHVAPGTGPSARPTGPAPSRPVSRDRSNDVPPGSSNATSGASSSDARPPLTRGGRSLSSSPDRGRSR